MMLVYGAADVGKSRWLATATDPLIVDLEHGLQSLSDKHIDFVSVDSYKEFVSILPEIRNYIKRADQSPITLCIDSLTELADYCLKEFCAEQKDQRRAYPMFYDAMIDLIKEIRALPCHTVFTAKHDMLDVNGLTVHAPRMPWRKLQSEVLHLFSNILYVGKNTKGQSVATATSRDVCAAKDRSGRLSKPLDIDVVSIAQVIQKVANG